jgi:hypothetical protein
MKLCWEKHFWLFDYGYDDSFGTGIIKNEMSFCISFKGYWIGM